MTSTDLFRPTTSAAPDEHAALLVALELSRSSWLGGLAPQCCCWGRRGAAWVARKTEAASRARQRAYRDDPGAGFDGFWLHRLLEAKGIESHGIAAVAANRRQRRAKTDRIDLDMLLRTLAAFRRGERRVCSMVHPPLPADEDRRRAGRERQRLITEKTHHLNRVKGLLATQGDVVQLNPDRSSPRHARLPDPKRASASS